MSTSFARPVLEEGYDRPTPHANLMLYNDSSCMFLSYAMQCSTVIQMISYF